jgi:anti-sigma B factor antagonist
MSTSSAKMMVYVSGDLACVKICGRANFTASVDFRKLLDELAARGFSCFILDLSECLLMDSTFLGILAGFGLKLAAPIDGRPRTGSIEVLNPNARIADSLENLGIAHLFKMVNGNACLPADLVSPSPVAPANPSRSEVTRTCLEAHKILMSVDPANVARFKEVTEFLAEDLKKLGNGH